MNTYALEIEKHKKDMSAKRTHGYRFMHCFMKWVVLIVPYYPRKVWKRSHKMAFIFKIMCISVPLLKCTPQGILDVGEVRCFSSAGG